MACSPAAALIPEEGRSQKSENGSGGPFLISVIAMGRKGEIRRGWEGLGMWRQWELHHSNMAISSSVFAFWIIRAV
ncbi:hypothetical protein CEXT_640811 [Caerostris extrusa]|uniref:Uncharacterized protein n=1 Tax=Caerostris extrusa TaxID=172846 RepID=A0AAV4MUU1_CAEEX|nr:hypothetical protein CEXT_640811 [Caerostris extrusa]